MVTENGIDGEHKLDSFGKIDTVDNKISVNISNLDAVPHVGLWEPHLSPRKAWVRCDDCHKWRRIRAALADQIEGTNCAWYIISYMTLTVISFFLVMC